MNLIKEYPPEEYCVQTDVSVVGEPVESYERHFDKLSDRSVNEKKGLTQKVSPV